MPGPEDREPLQQPVVRVRRLLPSEGHEAAACELQRRAGEPDPGDSGLEPDAQGLHSGPGSDEGGVLQQQQPVGLREGAGVHDRGVPPDDEEQQRQLPAVSDPGDNEADQGEGSGGNSVRADAGGRIVVLRQPRGERPGGVQGSQPGDHREPLRPVPRRREGQGLHKGHLQKGLNYGETAISQEMF